MKNARIPQTSESISQQARLFWRLFAYLPRKNEALLRVNDKITLDIRRLTPVNERITTVKGRITRIKERITCVDDGITLVKGRKTHKKQRQTQGCKHKLNSNHLFIY